MAFASTSSTIGFSTRSWVYQTITNLTRTFKQATARRRVFVQTRNELSSLSDVNLADIGLTRSQIDRVALETSIAHTH